MSAAPASPAADAARGQQRWLPWLIALPALLLATPLSPVALDPYPHLAGAGWGALLLVPLALVTLRRGASLRGAWPFVLTLGWALFALALGGLTDTFEARRAMVVLALFPLAFASGTALDADGRARLAWLLVALSLAWTGFALLAGAVDDNLAGVLGDTGSLSQAALPGAAVGALWCARATGRRRLVGGLALALFLAHVAIAPVLAGSHTLLAGLLLAALLGHGPRRGALAGLALAALLAPFVGMAARQAVTGEPPASVEGAPARSSRTLGGLGVRWLVWRSAVELVREDPLWGAGPGQFQAAFPPHRDPREIELSRHGVCSELDTEVEHAHNDWLQAFCELGIGGGLLFALGLALAARASLRAMRDEERTPLAVAAAALLVNAFVHAPLSSNVAAAVTGMAVLGAVSTRSPGRREPGAGVVVALPVLLAAFFALPLVRHGQALVDYARVARDVPEGRVGLAEAMSAREEAALAALRAAPDAAPARFLAARTGEDPDLYRAVLVVRPHSVEALEQLGTLEARRRGWKAAHINYARALELSPTHPRILRNMARLHLTRGQKTYGMDMVARLREQGCLDEAWLSSLGDELALVQGAPSRAAVVLFDRPLEELVPEQLHDTAERGADNARARECLAQVLWARQHADGERWEIALRNYRQAAQRSHEARGGESGPAPLYALELLACELRGGAEPPAVPPPDPDESTWRELAPWARETLQELGVERGE